MFFESFEIFNFTDDNTLYGSGIEFYGILENLEHDMKTILK